MKLFFSELLTAPNIMSLIRVLCAPLLLVFWMGLEWYIAGLAVGTVIGLTDLFDGIIARKLNQITELGALIDQLGDLVFESACLIIGALLGEIPVAFLMIYLIREFTVMVIRSYVVGKGGTLPSTVLGKAKSSFVQFAFFPLFLGLIVLQPEFVPESWDLIGIPPGRYLVWVGIISIFTGLVLSVISAWHYIVAFAEFYTEHHRSKKA